MEKLKMKKTFIIAEAGVNHNGDMALAKELIRKAKECGADAVKFQTFKTEKLVSKTTAQAKYQSQNIGRQESQAEMLKRLELSYEQFVELCQYCKEQEILFLSTAFDMESIDFLESLDMSFWKIPSGEITNLPYLEKISSLNKPMILSTGMANMEEVEAALNVLKNGQAITVLHCTTEYPTPPENVNLRAMQTIKSRFSVPVGYSDHTQGIHIPVAAVALGAEVIEKHFTLDKGLNGPDHKASLEPQEFKKMVQAIREVETSLGDGNKIPTKAEMENSIVARKCIVASKRIKEGELFSAENLTVQRAGKGISPMKWYDVLGKMAKREYQEEEPIEE